MKPLIIFILLYTGLHLSYATCNPDSKQERAIKKARIELMNELGVIFDEPQYRIENKFDVTISSDYFYWDGEGYIMAKSPLHLHVQWDSLSRIFPCKHAHIYARYPIGKDKLYDCHWGIFNNQLLLTDTYPILTSDSLEWKQTFLLNRLEQLLSESFSHDYDTIVSQTGEKISPKGSIKVTWIDSLDLRHRRTYHLHPFSYSNADSSYSTRTVEEIEVHPYLRLYFKEGVLTNIKFITPKVKEE